MSFTTDTRLELCRIAYEKPQDAHAELVAAILCRSGLSFKGPGRYGVSLISDAQPIAERHIALLKRFLSSESNLRVQKKGQLGGQTHFVVTPVEDATAGILETLHLLDMQALFGMRSAPSEGMLRQPSAQRAFLRGAFLACGSVNSPEKSYHLGFAVESEELAQSILTLMHGNALPGRISFRKEQPVVYLKDAEAISDMLALLGANNAVLRLEDARIMKGIRNDVNRQVNCDQFNTDQLLAASGRQQEAILAVGLEELPGPLRELARLRLAHPDVSLMELGNLMTPKLGKSGVSARMRKIEALAKEKEF